MIVSVPVTDGALGDHEPFQDLVANAFIGTLDDAEEVQLPLETVKVYIPEANPEIVVLVPVPVVVITPGYLVNVQVSEDGKPLKTTLPVGVAQVGCVIVPIVGVDGPVPELTTTIV